MFYNNNILFLSILSLNPLELILHSFINAKNIQIFKWRFVSPLPNIHTIRGVPIWEF